MQLAREKESPLLSPGVNLNKVDLSEEHCTWSNKEFFLSEIQVAFAEKTEQVQINVT